MSAVKFLCCLCILILDIQATTYWMVTEDGLIQPQNVSPFEMSRPYDLLAFLNQDARWSNILMLYEDLRKRGVTIDHLWSEIDNRSNPDELFLEDSDCIRAGPLDSLNWFRTAHYEDGRFRIPSHEYTISLKGTFLNRVEVPDCKKISSLTFSMHTFEHLQSMVKRENLTINPESNIMYPFIEERDKMGHWLLCCLKKNSSSWLHYNIASFFWRVHGNAPKAMECSRRAVHHAPREYKSIALFNMGMLLYRSVEMQDARTVLEAAYDHDTERDVSKIVCVLAKALALVGEYNTSIEYFDKCIELDPYFESVQLYRAATICYLKLMKRNMELEKLVKQVQKQVLEFVKIETSWFKLHSAYLRTKYRDDNSDDYISLDKSAGHMEELTGLNIDVIRKSGDKNRALDSFFSAKDYDPTWLSARGFNAYQHSYSFHKFVKMFNQHNYVFMQYGNAEVLLDLTFGSSTNLELEESDTAKVSTAEVNTVELNKPVEKKVVNEYETGTPLYPFGMKVDRKKYDFDTVKHWPSEEFCQNVEDTFPANLDVLYPVFIPFENKGIWLSYILSEKIGVPVNESHELPWRPPLCVNEKETSSFTMKKVPKSQKQWPVDSGAYLKTMLLEYVGEVDKVIHMPDSEIGQRIHTALKMKVAPRWILYTLASLYWRIRDNKVNAVQCLLNANKTVPVRHRDVVLTSLASVYMELGLFEDALSSAEDSAVLNLYEPATNMVLSQMNMIRDNTKVQLYLMKQVVRVDHNYLSGLARTLLNAWSCVLKQKNYGSCTQEDKDNSSTCGKDGVNCKSKMRYCYRKKNKESQNEKANIDPQSMDQAKETKESPNAAQRMVETLVQNLQLENNFAHDANYQKMRKDLDALLKECGPEGCLTMRPQDKRLNKESCSYEYMQLSYWLHLLSLRQLFAESDLRIPETIRHLPPSTRNQIPKCELTVQPEEDFYLQQLSKIKVGKWSPVISLMQQVAELLGHYDYVVLGAKIATYIEMNPNDFVGHLLAAWWCGAGGHSTCTMRCILTAYVNAPSSLSRLPFVAGVTLTHMNSQLTDAKELSYLLFYLAPKTKLGAFMVAVAHAYLREYEQAIWMFRYALYLDANYLPASACLQACICLMMYGDAKKTPEISSN